MRRRPRIAVNTAIHLHGTSGSSTATHALVAALRELPEVEVLEVSPAGRGGRGSLANALADARWDLRGASRAEPDIDLLVSPCNVGLRGRARRHLLVVHDMMALDHPHLFDPKFVAYFRALVPLSIRRADRVITPSAHSRDRILRRVPGADVRVVLWSAPAGTDGLRAAWPAEPTVLMAGATEPVKNQVAGIHAVALLRRRTGRAVRLRLIGRARRHEGEVRRALAAVDPDGRWTSREVDVPGEALRSAYATSWLLLHPSHDEGFGLPLLEAAAHGLPVVHSGQGAMPEVLPEVNAGGTAPEMLARGMEQLLEPDAWAAAADHAVSRAAAFDDSRLRSALHSAVDDLLPVMA